MYISDIPILFVCFLFLSTPIITLGLINRSINRNYKTTKAKILNRLENSAVSLDTSNFNFDYINQDKLPWIPDGYNTWNYNGHKINYLDIGSKDEKGNFISKPPLLLIHGFGASVYHWRYNIPKLARDYHVYAIDLLGFGLSDKPIMDYEAEVWRDQIYSFIEQVISKCPSRPTSIPCVVAGNSLGGFTALYSTALDGKMKSNLISGCILLNAAGRFKKFSSSSPKTEKPNWQKQIIGAISRFIIRLSFYYTKQPLRIEQVLKQVYPVNSGQVDRELVESIQYPAQHPNAPEVFYRVVSENGNGPEVFVDDLLADVSVPLLLLWGDKDPWIRPQAADCIQEILPSAVRVNINGGHCPHDENPEEVNREILKFMISIHTPGN